MTKLKFLVLLFTLCLSIKHVLATNVGFVGVTEYKKYQMMTSQFNGIVESLPINAGQQLAPSQLLFSIRPFDPLMQSQQSYSPEQELHVIQLFVKEGKNVSRFQPVAKLGRKQDIHIVAKTYTQLKDIDLGARVSILLDPDGLSIEVQGVITAYEPFNDNLFSGYQLEIGLEMADCLAQQPCKRTLKPGLLARVELMPKILSSD